AAGAADPGAPAPRARGCLNSPARTAPLPDGFRAAGRGGLGDLFDTMTRGTKVARTDARLRVSGPDRYRLDFSRRPRRIDSTTIARDGERRWRGFPGPDPGRPGAPPRGDNAVPAPPRPRLPRPAARGARAAPPGPPAP